MRAAVTRRLNAADACFGFNVPEKVQPWSDPDSLVGISGSARTLVFR